LSLTKSKERIQKHGEVFTPEWIVNDMLNLLPAEVWEIDKKFLEPACGEGAFLKEIYKIKLQNIQNVSQEKWEQKATVATSSIYGIELLNDNIKQCKQNLIQLFVSIYDKLFRGSLNEIIIDTVRFLVDKNIVQGNALTYRKCTVKCGNECQQCELIVFSEWIPIFENEKLFIKRKDFSYEGLVKSDEMKQKDNDNLFEEEVKNKEYGLIKEFETVDFKEIKNDTN